MPQTATSYDEIPYGGGAFAGTHPDRLATVATLAGLSPPPVPTCRILELGCGIGGNLLPLALVLPGAQLVGIDASARQIDQARDTAAALALGNVSFLAQDLCSLGPDFGTFDYIICHGVFSWVPHEVQEHILRICRQNLSAHGVVYISYNTYPGWHIRGMLRDLLFFHAGDVPVAIESDAAPARSSRTPRGRLHPTIQERLQQARSLLEFLPAALPNPETLFARLLLKEAESLGPSPDWYLFHEHLDGVNRPLHFAEFACRARAHGLEYVGEAVSWPPEHAPLTPAVAEQLDEMAPDLIRREQYEDFLRCRMFRRTLLCHAEAQPSRVPDWRTVMGMRAATTVCPESDPVDIDSSTPEKFHTTGGATITTNHPVVKAALTFLAGAAPRSVPFDELWATIRSRLSELSSEEQDQPGRQFLAEALVRCHTSDLVQLHLLDDAFAVNVGDRPCGSPLARLQASREEERVTNLRHRSVEPLPFDRLLLPLLDGTRDREAVVSHLATLAGQDVFAVEHHGEPVQDPALLREVLLHWTEEGLRRLASQALLIG
jgi:methyltransferase-like protein